MNKFLNIYYILNNNAFITKKNLISTLNKGKIIISLLNTHQLLSKRDKCPPAVKKIDRT